MNNFFSKIPNKELLIELLNKKDYLAILGYAKPLNPQTSISKLLDLFQTTDSADNEFCLYMAIITAKLKSGDLIEALDEYISDITTVSERRDLYFWKAKNLGVIADIFEKELSKYSTLLLFLYRVPKEDRNKYFSLDLTKETFSNLSLLEKNPTSEIIPLFSQKTDQETMFSKRVLILSPDPKEAHKLAREAADRLSAYRVELRPEFVKLIGNPLLAIRLVGELANKYRPLVLIYPNFAGINHEDIDSIFLEQTTKDLLAQDVPQETYFIALTQSPLDIYSNTYEERWFQKALFLPPSSPKLRREFFRKNPITMNFDLEFLVQKSSFYSLEELKHLIHQLINPGIGDLVKIFEESKPRYEQWVLDVAFLRTWTYYPVWKDIYTYTELENAFKNTTQLHFKESFTEDFLALEEIEKNPASILSYDFSPLVKFTSCRKSHSIPFDIVSRLLNIMDLPLENTEKIQQKLFSFLLEYSKPQALSADLKMVFISWAMKGQDFALIFLATKHELTSDQLLLLTKKFQTEEMERKILYYLQRNEIHDSHLLYCLARTFKTHAGQVQIIRALRNEIEREKDTSSLKKLFLLLVNEFGNKTFWPTIADSFNAVNSSQNFSPTLTLNKRAESIFGFNTGEVFSLLVDVMGDPELQSQSPATEWVTSMLEGSQPEESWAGAIERFKILAGKMIHDKKINQNERTRFLKSLMNWKVGEKWGLHAWLTDLTSDIDFSSVAWGDLKNTDFLKTEIPTVQTIASEPRLVASPPNATTVLDDSSLLIAQSLSSAKIQLQTEKLKQDIALVMASDDTITEKLKKIEDLQATFEKLFNPLPKL